MGLEPENSYSIGRGEGILRVIEKGGIEFQLAPPRPRLETVDLFRQTIGGTATVLSEAKAIQSQITKAKSWTWICSTGWGPTSYKYSYI